MRNPDLNAVPAIDLLGPKASKPLSEPVDPNSVKKWIPIEGKPGYARSEDGRSIKPIYKDAPSSLHFAHLPDGLGYQERLDLEVKTVAEQNAAVKWQIHKLGGNMKISLLELCDGTKASWFSYVEPKQIFTKAPPREIPAAVRSNHCTIEKTADGFRLVDQTPESRQALNSALNWPQESALDTEKRLGAEAVSWKTWHASTGYKMYGKQQVSQEPQRGLAEQNWGQNARIEASRREHELRAQQAVLMMNAANQMFSSQPSLRMESNGDLTAYNAGGSMTLSNDDLVTGKIWAEEPQRFNQPPQFFGG